jgi:hypothetical protein
MSMFQPFNGRFWCLNKEDMEFYLHAPLQRFGRSSFSLLEMEDTFQRHLIWKWKQYSSTFPESVEVTNKMQPCNRIYYSKVYWRINMFRAAYRLSSGALNCICSLWFIYTCGGRPLPSFPLSLDNGRSPHVYINQRLQIQLRASDDERCATRNMLSLQ